MRGKISSGCARLCIVFPQPCCSLRQKFTGFGWNRTSSVQTLGIKCVSFDRTLCVRNYPITLRTLLTGLESRGRPVQGWNALVAVPSMECLFCFFQLLLHGFSEEAGLRCYTQGAELASVTRCTCPQTYELLQDHSRAKSKHTRYLKQYLSLMNQ